MMNELTDPPTFVDPSPLAASGAPGAHLILVSSSSPTAIGKVLRLQPGQHLLGRGVEASLRIEDQGVSRRHALIDLAQDGTCSVTDLDSTNGTYLNGKSISSARLREGDRLQIGTRTVFRFSTGVQLDPREEQLRVALSAARVGIWEWDAPRGVLTWSEHVDQMLELPLGKLSGRAMDPRELLHPEDLPRVHEALASALERRAHVELEFRILPGGGDFLWLSCKGDVLCDSHGVPTRITGTVMDITSRKLAEQELRRQALIFENLYDAVVVTDLEGRILDWNPSAEQLFGHAKALALGRTLFTVLYPREPDRLTGTMLATLEREGRWTGEVEFRRSDGSPCFCESVAVPLRDAKGCTVAYILIHRDITERKQLQAQLIMADRLASLGTLGAGMAHEINNPLGYMLSNLRYLSEELQRLESAEAQATVESLRQIVQETREGAERIASIVRDLQAFTRGEQDTRQSPVDVRPAIELSCKMVSNVLRHRARLVTEFQEVPQVLAHESRLGQVFLNLLINAAQAIPEGAPHKHQVTVRVRPGKPGQVVVEVQDTGQGMTPEVLARAFDPFFTTKPAGVGTGLGLSICHGILESMGGTISVESTPGQGSTFRVSLRTEGVEEEKPPHAPARSRTDEATATRARPALMGGRHRQVPPARPLWRSGPSSEASLREPY